MGLVWHRLGLPKAPPRCTMAFARRRRPPRAPTSPRGRTWRRRSGCCRSWSASPRRRSRPSCSSLRACSSSGSAARRAGSASRRSFSSFSWARWRPAPASRSWPAKLRPSRLRRGSRWASRWAARGRRSSYPRHVRVAAPSWRGLRPGSRSPSLRPQRGRPGRGGVFWRACRTPGRQDPSLPQGSAWVCPQSHPRQIAPTA
mmetsp:Transcript_83861/g.227337  ORF Transcript_83861/g.227337 Transcript_83861/m.227337 type:complete len:201 (+) Transcript_83861:1264-1866(+)